MVSDPGPGVGDEQVHLDDPDLKPVQLRQVGPARQDPLTEFCSSVSELFEPEKEVRVFHGFESVNQASRLLGEVGLTTRLGDSSAHRAHPFNVRITAIMEKVAP